MSLFGKRKPASALPSYPPEQYEPVLRSSICTGEQTACMRNRETGRMHEVMLIRDSSDLENFAAQYGVDVKSIRTVY